LNEGSRFAIVTRRSGLRDLVVYDKDDTEEARVDLVLEEAEANAIAELLGGPQIMNALKAIDDTKGLVVQQLPLQRSRRTAAGPWAIRRHARVPASRSWPSARQRGPPVTAAGLRAEGRRPDRGCGH
jgi:hypothetical protein